jgi:hypothetical protein
MPLVDDRAQAAEDVGGLVHARQRNVLVDVATAEEHRA